MFDVFRRKASPALVYYGVGWLALENIEACLSDSSQLTILLEHSFWKGWPRMDNLDFTALLETPQEQLHKYIELMDDYQARLVLSFVKTLFNLAD